MAAPKYPLWALGLIIADQVVVWLSLHNNLAHAATHRIVVVPFLLSFCVAAVLFTLLWKQFQKSPLALTLISAGFLSNVLTLITRHTVYDYIPTGVSYTNAADLLFSVGCGILVWRVLSTTFRR